MKPISNTYTITATDADGICLSQTPLAAGALTLNGALVAGIPTGQHITIGCAGADAGRTFTVTGTDTSGNTITEEIAGSNISTTTSTKNFKTFTSVVVDAATAGAIVVGIVQTLETQWIPLDYKQHPFVYAYQVDIGTATFTVEGTLDRVQDRTIVQLPFTVQASGGVDVAGSSVIPQCAVRVKVTAWTSGTVVFKVLQG